MAVVKQKSVDGGTIKLKQLKNDTNLSNNQYKYVVEFPDGDRTDPRFTKENGIREFNRVVKNRGGSTGGGGVGGLLGF